MQEKNGEPGHKLSGSMFLKDLLFGFMEGKNFLQGKSFGKSGRNGFKIISREIYG